jgi:hypothetical protein
MFYALRSTFYVLRFTDRSIDRQFARSSFLSGCADANQHSIVHSSSPRDGKNLTAPTLVRGLRAAYGLSRPLAILLAYGGFGLVCHPFHALFRGLNLYQFCEHKPHLGTEHDASLVHRDISFIPEITTEVAEIEQVDEKTGKSKNKKATKEVVMAEKKSSFPPMEIVSEWVVDLLDDISPLVDKRVKDSFREAWLAKDLETCSSLAADIVINADDIARARVRREKESLAAKEEALKACPQQEQDVKKVAKKAKKSGKRTGALDTMHTAIAQGEVAIILAMWERLPVDATTGLEDKNGKRGVPLIYFLTFLQYETIPSVPTGTIAPPATGTTTAFSTPASTQSKRKSIRNSIPFLNKTSRSSSPSSEDLDEKKDGQGPAEARVQWTPTKKVGFGAVQKMVDGIVKEMGNMLEKEAGDAAKAKTSVSSEA